MTVFPSDVRSKAIIFAFYHLRFILLKSSALLLCLLLFIKAKPLIFLAVICWPHVTNKSSNRLFFLQSRVFLHELVPFILRQSGNRLCQFWSVLWSSQSAADFINLYSLARIPSGFEQPLPTNFCPISFSQFHLITLCESCIGSVPTIFFLSW